MIKDTQKLLDDVRLKPELHNSIRVAAQQFASYPGTSVWLYHRFCLSFRDVEDLLAERGVIVPTKLFGVGVTNSVQHTLERSRNVEVLSAIHGIWMRLTS